jgi:hypothetical protein
LQVRKKREEKTKNKMANLSPIISIITLNTTNTPIKRQSRLKI